MKNHRNNCILCNSQTYELYSTKMPVFMGVNKNCTDEKYHNMTFSACNNCGELQISEILDPNLVYQNNHNLNVVGKIWKQHYEEFSSFISQHIINKNILEISDPSAKIAKLTHGFKKWSIVEPNPNNNPPEIKNVVFIKKFFDQTFETSERVDVIVHSHFLEHLENPVAFLKKCFDILKENGEMFVSIPNMDFILDNNFSPANTLHFEHTYFINYEVMNYLGELCGFKIEEIKEYKNHSLFYKLKKISKTNKNKINLNIVEKFKNLFNIHKNNINNINNFINNENNFDIFLFGAHVSSQFYLFNGLNIDKIKAILDNDIEKQGYDLYGTNLKVVSPSIIEQSKCIVICSHVGVYSEEIKKQLIEINKDVIIL